MISGKGGSSGGAATTTKNIHFHGKFHLFNLKPYFGGLILGMTSRHSGGTPDDLHQMLA